MPPAGVTTWDSDGRTHSATPPQFGNQSECVEVTSETPRGLDRVRPLCLGKAEVGGSGRTAGANAICLADWRCAGNPWRFQGRLLDLGTGGGFPAI